MKNTRFISSLSILFIIATFTNCSSKHKQPINNTNALKLGYIVHADKDEVQALAESGVEVRTINAKADLFEIRGMAEPEIKRVLGKSAGFEIEKNRVVYQPEIGNKAKSFDEKLEEKGIKIPAFANPCKNNPFDKNEKLPANAPIPSIDEATLGKSAFFSDKYNGTVSYINSEIKLTGINSIVTDDKIEAKLNYVWVVIPPEYSSINPKAVIATSDISFKADALGVYSAMLLVQDQNNLCNYTSIDFGVTANAKYTFAEAFKIPEGIDFYKNFQQLSLMNVNAAWEKSQGEGVTVAVIDSGVNYLSPFLAKNIAVNSKEIPDNKKDDDQNGYVDDVYGWDFVNEDSMPLDDQGHGTHVAGLIASTAFGVAPKAKILPIKVFNTGGSGDIATILMAFMYAVDQGVDVINFSGGAEAFRFKVIKSALDYAKSKNVTVVVAAGNNGSNNDEKPFFPTNIVADNLISVASTNSKHELSYYSNFGINTVKVAAPGGDDKVGGALNSAAVWNPKGSLITAMQGTSMSSPMVAGTVALMLSMDPTLKSQNLEIEKLLAQSVTSSDALINKVKYPGVINANKVIEFIKTKKSTNP
ncbi:MAG: S8 family peptidase [Bacteriovoracaceae bacterium]